MNLNYRWPPPSLCPAICLIKTVVIQRHPLANMESLDQMCGSIADTQKNTDGAFYLTLSPPTGKPCIS
jgi:hypothetical protein